MSSSPQLGGGGGGGGDDTTSGGSGDGTTSDTETSILAFSRREIRQLSLIVNDPRVWIVSVLTGFSIEMSAQLLTQKSAIAIIIDDYIFRSVLLPLGLQLFAGVLNIIDEFILAAFGTDRAVGIVPGTRPGVVDIPILIVRPVIQGFLTTGLTVFLAVDTLNRSIVGSLPGLGIFGPTLVNILFVTELIAIGATLWLLISFIPVFNVRGIFLSLMTIPRRVLRRLL